jgi:dimethylhistidine N-methyltransferase
MDAQNTLAEAQPFANEFAQAVINGLGAREKYIPCHFLYDARGSELFEKITQLDEYYPTRTEIALLQKYGPRISQLVGTDCAVIEFGSGSSRKTHVLIESLQDIAAYVPIDIAGEALSEAAESLRKKFSDLTVIPVNADFNDAIELPDAVAGAPKLGFFPGSTIGNFSHADAAQFLADAGELLGRDSAFLVGVDLKKDTDTLLAAYNDAEGVTAEFNLNLLTRINRQLDGDIDLAKYKHEAVYNETEGRIEIYIVSLDDQKLSVLGQPFTLARGERIHTENSHKYSVEEFGAMARKAGWQSDEVWIDDRALFSLHFLSRD